MTVLFNDFVYALTQYDPSKNLEQFAPFARTIEELRIRFLEVNSELGSMLDIADDLKVKLIKITKNKILEGLKSNPDGAATLTKVINEFEKICARVIPKQTSFYFPHWPLRVHPLYASFQPQLMQTAPLQLYGPTLIAHVSQMQTSDEIVDLAKQIQIEQVHEIVNSDQCNQAIPRLLTFLPHAIFTKFLLDVDDEKAKKVNVALIAVRGEEWFTEKFKHVREHFVNTCNQMAAKIDELNRKLRLIHLADISNETIERIEALHTETNQAWEAQQRLQILVRNIIFDCETEQLFSVEIPKRYIGLLNRLSDKKQNQALVSGCPYGILYRLAYDSFANDDETLSQKEKEIELVSVITTWLPDLSGWVDSGIIEAADREQGLEAYSIGIKNLAKINITSISDLKTHRIFNSAMLQHYIEKKRKEPVDGESSNLIQSLTRLWRN